MSTTQHHAVVRRYQLLGYEHIDCACGETFFAPLGRTPTQKLASAKRAQEMYERHKPKPYVFNPEDFPDICDVCGHEMPNCTCKDGES